MLSFLGTVIVALIGLVGICIQTKAKVRQESISAKLDMLRKESKEDDARLNKKLDQHILLSDKRWLVNELTKIREGTYVPNEEQKYLIHETKKQYNDEGGNSYVDNMFNDLVHKGLL